MTKTNPSLNDQHFHMCGKQQIRQQETVLVQFQVFVGRDELFVVSMCRYKRI